MKFVVYRGVKYKENMRKHLIGNKQAEIGSIEW